MKRSCVIEPFAVLRLTDTLSQRLVHLFVSIIVDFITEYQKDNGKTRSAIVIRSASIEDNGKYTCTTSEKTVRQISTFITVQGRLINAINFFVGKTVK